MQQRWLVLPLLAGLAAQFSSLLDAQSKADISGTGRVAIYGGFAWVSNSFNSYGSNQSPGMIGWDADAAFPLRSRFSLEVEGLGFYDNHLGDPEHAHFFLAGPRFEYPLARKKLFAYGLAGYGHINPQAVTQGINIPGTTSTFSADLGGGIDIPFSSRIAWRVQGGVLYANFPSASDQIHGRPNWFGRLSTGVVLHF